MKTRQEPLPRRCTYQIHPTEQLDVHFQLPATKPTFDYIADIQHINEELLSTNTTNISSVKQLHHNTSNCSLKIDDCSDIEGHPSSFIMQPSSSPRTSTLLSALTTNKLNNYFQDSLMCKLRREYAQNGQRTVTKTKQNCLFVKPLLTEETRDRVLWGNKERLFRNNNNNTEHRVTDDTYNSYSNSNSNNHSRSNEEAVQFTVKENKRLKCMVTTYKRLLDTLFYFINSLSHNYSFEKKFYQVDNYTNNEDALMKELLSLEKCIHNNINVSLIDNQHQELLAKLRITQEHSLTILTFNDNSPNDNNNNTNNHTACQP